MAEISSSSSSDVFFSSCQSNNCAWAIWKVKEFSTIESNCSSPAFSFKDIEWHLDLYPLVSTGKNAGYVSLYLRPLSSFESKFELIVKNDSGKDIRKGNKKWNFLANKGLGYPKFLNRKDLLDGKLGNILPNDILTICCKLETDENVETEASTDSEGSALNCETDSFLSKFRQTLDSGKLSDVVLRAGEESLRAHKVILSTHSDVFQAMFESNLKECQDDIVDLVDMDPTVAKAMLLYIYTSEVEELSPEKTLELYVAADRYMLTGLKEECRDYVSDEMSAQTVLEVFEVAKLHSDTVLLRAAETFFARNVKSILKSEEWKKYSAQNPTSSVELLSHAIASNDLFFFS